jgi:uncharacterized protein YndB with AHSA1/START domain
MVKNEHTVVIGCSPERAFRFVTDFDTWRQWHGSDQSVAEKATPGPVDVGTVWNVSGPVQGQLIAVTIEVTRFEPYSQYEFKTTSGPIDARQAFVFEHVEGGTKLTTVLELTDPQLAQPARQQWDKDLLTLKQLLEAQADGNPCR